MKHSQPHCCVRVNTEDSRWQVVASAFAQYCIFSYVLVAVFCFASSGLSFAAVLTINGNMPVRIIFEVALGILATTCLVLVGNRVIFNRAGELVHPVAWTWYSSYLLVVYLLRGLLAGIVRMITMVVWIVVQIGIIDRTNFPEGREHMDPAFASFFQTLRFHHR
jgi:hypothetical protein